MTATMGEADTVTKIAAKIHDKRTTLKFENEP